MGDNMKMKLAHDVAYKENWKLKCKYCGWVSKDKNSLMVKEDWLEKLLLWLCPNCMKWGKFRWFEIKDLCISQYAKNLIEHLRPYRRKNNEK